MTQNQPVVDIKLLYNVFAISLQLSIGLMHAVLYCVQFAVKYTTKIDYQRLDRVHALSSKFLDAAVDVNETFFPCLRQEVIYC